jgi:hypothetical protein
MSGIGADAPSPAAAPAGGESIAPIVKNRLNFLIIFIANNIEAAL